MMILALVRNYIPSYQLGRRRRLEHRRLRRPLLRPRGHAGRHRRRRTHRLRRAASPQAVRGRLHYTTATASPDDVEQELGVTFHDRRRVDWSRCATWSPSTRPLHPETEHMFNDALIGKMKRGAYLVNTARARSATATPSPAPSRPDSSPATPATSGSRSQPRKTIHGDRCRTTA